MFTSSAAYAALVGRNYSEYLLGDSGYACQPFLMTPVLNPASAAERRYNVAHIATRNIVERTFGIWKKRFHCLTNKLTLKLETVTTVISATVVLHNIAARYMDLNDPEQVFMEDVPDYREPDNALGAAARRALIARHFN